MDDVVTDLLPTAYDHAKAARSNPAVELTAITPGDWMRGDGPRPALVTPAPTTLTFAVTVPAGALLRVGVGIGGVTRREKGVSGVQFTLTVDGRQRFARTVEPGATRRDRRWFDELIALDAATERVMTLTLATSVATPGRPVAGVPGWSRLQIVRRTAYPRQPASMTMPNVLVLLVDTLRGDRVGGRPTLTPHIDALGARGLVFERAIAQSSWTLQSVPSILTGLLPASHGVRGNFWGDPTDDDAAGEHLPDPLETLAESAARAGITTVGVSANPLVSRATNLAQGFETFHEFGWDPKAKRFASADEVNGVFIDWLRHHADLRFFAYLHYMDVHDPYTPPASARPAPPSGISEALANGWVLETARRINFHGAPKLPEAQVAYLRRLYDGEVQAWDGTLPTLLDALRAAGVLESTVVVVTSDHGEEFQEHGWLKHGQSLHEELVHVPLVVAGSGIPVGRRTVQVQGIDLFPTIAHILGFPVPPSLRGRDLLKDTLDDANVVSATSHAVGDTPGAVVDSLSLRTRDWTLLAYPASRRYALFYRPDDPFEHRDRFATAPESATLVAALEARLAAAPLPPPSSPIAADLGERLRALGYAD